MKTPMHPGRLADDYRRVRAQTDALVDPLSAEDQCAQSMPDASPAKWHRAHTTWFFETFVLKPAGVDVASPPAYAKIFNSYYNTVGEQFHRPSRGLLTRPSHEEVTDYRRRVDDAVSALLEDGIRNDLAQRIELGLHHEQQHQELILTDVKHLLSQNPLDPAYLPADRGDETDPGVSGLTWSTHAGGVTEVGHTSDAFHFDNEGPAHEVMLRPFQIANRIVTNGEYMAFVQDGGYERSELWLSDGWATVQEHQWQAPMYWRKDPDGLSSFTLHGRQPVRLNEPVMHVSYYEADAYARWADARLPTEFEWEAGTLPPEPGPLCGRAPEAHPTRALLYGACWQWTQSSYSAYPAFAPQAGAIGEYNGKFMCSQQVLRGSSCATPRGHARHTYRNFFPPDARWQFSGIRLARESE